jgi:DNA-binding transcriptional regulator WhiA
MEDRVGFESNEIQKEFFCSVRIAHWAKSWEQLGELFDLSRGSFQTYQYGGNLMPKSLFDKMNASLTKEKQTYFNERIFTKPGNWGAKKGGNITFRKHPEICAKGRAISLMRKKADALQRPVRNIHLSAQLCEFIGAIIGDGNVDGSLQKRNGLPNYTISITGDSRLDRDYLSNHHPDLINSTFKVKSQIYFRKDCNAMILKIYSKMVFCLLIGRFGFKPGNKTYSVKIPEEILQSNTSLIFATIRGIFDTDGTVFFDKRLIYNQPYPRIALQIVSKPLFLQLKEFLQKYFSIYTFEDKKRKAYRIEIYGAEQLCKWMQLIGFSNKRHLDKVKYYYKPEGGIGPPTTS